MGSFLSCESEHREEEDIEDELEQEQQQAGEKEVMTTSPTSKDEDTGVVYPRENDDTTDDLQDDDAPLRREEGATSIHQPFAQESPETTSVADINAAGEAALAEAMAEADVAEVMEDVPLESSPDSATAAVVYTRSTVLGVMASPAAEKSRDYPPMITPPPWKSKPKGFDKPNDELEKKLVAQRIKHKFAQHLEQKHRQA